MSQLLDSIKKHVSSCHLSWVDSLKLVLHFPLFKLHWYASYGSGLIQTVAQKVYGLLDSYKIYITLRTVQGERYQIPIGFNSADLDSYQEIFWGGEYDLPKTRDEVKTIVDIGANTGMSTYFFLNYFDFEKLISVEANSQLAGRIEGSLKSLGGMKNKVFIENLAVTGNQTGDCYFRIEKNHRLSRIVTEPMDGDKNIGCLPLRDLLAKHDLKGADLLKIDIEGGEFPILDEDPSVFQLFKYIFIEIHGDRQKRDQFVGKLRGLGFHILNRNMAEPMSCETSFFQRDANGSQKLVLST